jgi:hypothetical protein
VKINVVGTPLAGPALLFASATLQDPPLPTPYGLLALGEPLALGVSLGEVPGSGIAGLAVQVPLDAPPGATVYLQALLPGADHTLTNVEAVTVQ